MKRTARRRWSKLLPKVGLVVAIATLLGVWELAARLHAFGVTPGILPPFTLVWERASESKALLATHLSLTLWETVAGFGLALALAAFLATLFDWVRWLRAALFPILTAFQSIPKVALAPLFVIWMGHGGLPNIAMAALIAFFPLLVNFATGLDSTSEELELFMDNLAATWWQRFRKARLPSAVPYILSGCKVGITFALIGAIVGEFTNPSRGLGYIIETSKENFETTLQFASITIVSVMGWILFEATRVIEFLFFRRYTAGTRSIESATQM